MRICSRRPSADLGLPAGTGSMTGCTAAHCQCGSTRHRPLRFASWLTAWLHGAVNIRIHPRVIEGTCDDRYRNRTCPATVNGSCVIAALPGGDTADDQPGDKKHRSDVHLDLRIIAYIKLTRQPIAIAGLYFGPASPREPTRVRRYRVQRARIQRLFQTSGSRAGIGDRVVAVRHLHERVSRYTAGARGLLPGNFQTSGSWR